MVAAEEGDGSACRDDVGGAPGRSAHATWRRRWRRERPAKEPVLVYGGNSIAHTPTCMVGAISYNNLKNVVR